MKLRRNIAAVAAFLICATSAAADCANTEFQGQNFTYCRAQASDDIRLFLYANDTQVYGNFRTLDEALAREAHYTTRALFVDFGVETTGEMDSEHGLIPCKDFVHDQLLSRRSAEDANPTCASGQDPS